MTQTQAQPAHQTWRPVIVLIAAVTLARLLYLAFLCPYTLIEDETNYWEWSRHLSLSYYTKGPGIAWTIAAFTRALGETEFAIRAIAALSCAVTATCIAGLTHDLTRSTRAAFLAVAILFLMPVFQVLSLITTIDGPYAACWALASWSAYRAVTRRSPTAFLTLALALGIGVLYKYTMLMFLPGLLAYVWAFRREHAAEANRPFPTLAFVASLVLFAVTISPIIIWNHDQGWPTLRHLLGHLQLAGGDQPVRQGNGQGWTYKPQWTLGYVGSQLAIAGPMLILAFLQARRARRERTQNSQQWKGVAYLLSLSVPILVLYFLVSFLTNPQGNWALAGFITLIPLAAWSLITELTDNPRMQLGIWKRPLAWHAFNATLILGLITGLGMLRIDLLTKLPAAGKYIPIWRATGADDMAAHTREIADELKAETGEEPFFMALHYGRAAQLSFYMPGRPTVFCSSSLMLNGRMNPYDFWPDTDLRQLGSQAGSPTVREGSGQSSGPVAGSLLGRNAVLNGASLPDWQPLFDRVELVGTLRSDGKKGRPSFKAYGFKGFPPGGLRTPDAPETFPRNPTVREGPSPSSGSTLNPPTHK